MSMYKSWQQGILPFSGAWIDQPAWATDAIERFGSMADDALAEQHEQKMKAAKDRANG